MKTLLAVLVVLVLAVGGVAYWRGWFTVEAKHEGDSTHVDVKLNKEKFKQDKEKLQAEAAQTSKALKDKLAGLREKSRGLSGEDKAKADKEIDEMSRKHESLEAKLKDLEEAGEDKFEELKKSITGAIEEHRSAAGK
jgi:hypothetical protein